MAPDADEAGRAAGTGRRMSAPSAADHAARVVLRPIGNPLPLGFLALAVGTLLVSGLQLGWLDPSEGSQVGLILIVFVFPLQLLASVLGFLARDVVAGTGMGLLAGTWASIALIKLTSQPGATSDPLGLLLLLAALAMLVPTAASVTGKLVPAAVLATTAVRFATTGLYELTASGTWKDLAGIVGVALCALAVYTALAMALEDARRQTSLPLGRRGVGGASIGGTLDQQLERIEHEAGVREQL
jgi:succinate-acetate transporter protein